MEDIKQIPPPVFRKGLPTKKWLKEAKEMYFGSIEHRIYIHTYMRVYIALQWNTDTINGDVKKFCTVLYNFSIPTEKFVPYIKGTGMIGSVAVLPKIENKI